MGAIQFIENMDRTTLTITDDEFEKNVEAAVSAIAEKHRAESPPLPTPPLSEKDGTKTQQQLLQPGESSTASATTRLSTDSDAARLSMNMPRRSTSLDEDEDKDAITGLLRTIQKPLSTIGRIFSEEPLPPSPTRGEFGGIDASLAGDRPSTASSARRALSAEEAAARQASAEAAEAQRLHRVEHASVVETLASMFPDLDREIISDVVYQKEGRYVTDCLT